MQYSIRYKNSYWIAEYRIKMSYMTITLKFYAEFKNINWNLLKFKLVTTFVQFKKFQIAALLYSNLT